MSIESHIWTRYFFIPRALPCFFVPTSVVESEARSTLYHLKGARRSRESHTVVFQYTLSGEGIYTKDETTSTVSEGSGFLSRVSDPAVTYGYPEGATVPYRFLFFTFKDSANSVESITRELGHVFKLPIDDPVIRRLQEFGRLDDTSIELTAGEGHLLVNSLLAKLVDGIRNELSHTSHVRLVRRAERLVRKNMNSPYNAGMLADDLGVSQEHLCRIFRREVGTTPLAFLNEIKIRAACEMLRTTSMSCRSIAQNLGYSPGSHFVRLFKRITTMTPGEFRRSEIIAF